MARAHRIISTIFVHSVLDCESELDLNAVFKLFCVRWLLCDNIIIDAILFDDRMKD